MKSIERIEVRVVTPIDNPQLACRGNQVRESILVRFRYGQVRYQGRVIVIRNHIPWTPTSVERSNNATPPQNFRNYLCVERDDLSDVIDRFFRRHDGTGFLFLSFRNALRKLLDEKRMFAETA